MSEEKKASAVLDELRETIEGGLAARRPNGPQRGESGAEIGVGYVSKRSKIQELRDVEDVVMFMSPGVARNRLLSLLRVLRDDVMDELVVPVG